MKTIVVTKEKLIKLQKMDEWEINNQLENYNVPHERIDHIEWNEGSVVIHDRCKTTAGGTLIDNSYQFVLGEKEKMPILCAGIRAEWRNPKR